MKKTESRGISRRDFIKGAAAGAAGVAAAGLFGSISGESNAGVSVSQAPLLKRAFEMEISEEELADSCVETQEITEFSAEYEYDVVVVGAGAAGVPAALSAKEEGATVACLQKQSIPVSQGNAGSGVDLDNSDEIGVYRFMMQTNELCSWRADWNQLKTYCEKSGEAVKWVIEKGIEGGFEVTSYQNEFTYEDEYKCTTIVSNFGPKPLDTGSGMVAIASVAEKEGVDFYYETPAVQLLTEGGSVVGVVGKDSDGNYIKFTANKAVILAAGDYQNNDHMVMKYCPDVYDFDKKQYQKTGDAQLMGMLAGAVMEPLGHTKMLHDFDSGPMYDEPFLCVNDNAERFMNEESTFEYVNNVCRTQVNPGWYCQIFDNDYVDTVNEWGGVPTDQETIQKYIPGAVENPEGVRTELIDTHTADTLEELAEMLQIEDTETFLATIARYNELCESGVDSDFGKLPKYMKPIQTAPFWGIRKHLRVSSILSGLLTNENGQCLDINGEIIPGLYAAGNCAGQFYGAVDYPLHSYGMSLGRCYTFGRIAGLHAASL